MQNICKSVFYNSVIYNIIALFIIATMIINTIKSTKFGLWRGRNKLPNKEFPLKRILRPKISVQAADSSLEELPPKKYSSS